VGGRGLRYHTPKSPSVHVCPFLIIFFCRSSSCSHPQDAILYEQLGGHVADASKPHGEARKDGTEGGLAERSAGLRQRNKTVGMASSVRPCELTSRQHANGGKRRFADRNEQAKRLPQWQLLDEAEELSVFLAREMTTAQMNGQGRQRRTRRG